MNLIKNFFESAGIVAGGLAVAILCIAVLCLAPFLLIFSINFMAEAGGADFYIPHGIKNYLVAFLVLILVRGGGSSSDG